jgi:hypothetical protein
VADRGRSGLGILAGSMAVVVVLPDHLDPVVDRVANQDNPVPVLTAGLSVEASSSGKPPSVSTYRNL